MAGRSGRAGVSRGEEGGKAVQGVDTARGESFLILPVCGGTAYVGYTKLCCTHFLVHDGGRTASLLLGFVPVAF